MSQPADRFIDAQAWWIASELARRHPELRIAETLDPEVGTSLALYNPEEPERSQVIFNRVAGIHHVGAFLEITWEEAFAAPSPHDIVRRLEPGFGILAAGKTPPTNEETIGYRVIASALNLLVNDRASWMMRGNRPGESILSGFDWAGDVSGLPTLDDFRIDFLAVNASGGGDGSITDVWFLLRDLVPVAALDCYGKLHLPSGRVDMLAAYVASGRTLAPTLTSLLGELLP